MCLQSSLGFLDHDLITHISYWHKKTSDSRLWAGGLYLFFVNFSSLLNVSVRNNRALFPYFKHLEPNRELLRLDAHSYRLKYGIPHSQPLAARATVAKRRQIAAEVRPWEKAPAYMKAQKQKAAAAKKSGRKKQPRSR
jgi:hypothetical protein